MPCFLAISGYQNSGKTTVGTFLVKTLTQRGYKIGVVKASKEEEIITDFPQKDTWKYRASGASAVGLFQKYFFTLYLTPENHQILDYKDWYNHFISLFWSYDLVIFEGFKSFEMLPKLWVIKNKDEDLKSIKNTLRNLLGFIVKDEVKYWRSKHPEEVFLSLEEKDVFLDFVERFIEKNQPRVLLRVNGKKLALKDFVEEILAYPLLGFIRALKGVPEEVWEIEVKIKPKFLDKKDK